MSSNVSLVERSMTTNVVLSLIFVVIIALLVVVPDSWRPYYLVSTFSVMRSCLPILTAVANFGTVKTVSAQYWEHTKHLANIMLNKR